MKGPTPYRPEMPRLWWLEQPGYLRYMIREITCVWVGAWVTAAIVGLIRLGQGPEAWERYWQALGSTAGIVFQVVALAFVVYHAVSWFSLAPSTMPVWIGENRVSPRLIEAVHYLVWVALSLVILLLAGI